MTLQAAQKKLDTEANTTEYWLDYGRFVKFAIGLVVVSFVAAYARAVLDASFVVDQVRYFVLFDDSMICLRFAYNLAHGNGLVWNAGEFVQGYTNLGWVLLMTAAHFVPVGLPKVSLIVQLLGLNAILITLLVVGQWLNKRVDLPMTLLGITLTAFCAPIFFWSVGGMETPLHALLLTAALLPLVPKDNEFTERDKWPLSAFLLGIAFFVRPDSIVAFGTGVFSIALYSFKDRKRRVKTWCGIALGAAIIAAVLGFQQLYYGDWLPNTYYLKVANGARQLDRGLHYLASFLFSDHQLFTVCGAMLLIVKGSIFSEKPWNWLGIALCTIGWIGYVVWVGGDVFVLSRFFAPIIPVLIAMAVCFLFEVKQSLGLVNVPATLEKLAPVSMSAVSRSQLWRDGAATAVFLAAVILLAIIPCRCIQDVSPELIEMKEQNWFSVLNFKSIQSLGLLPNQRVAVFWGGGVPYFMPNQLFHDPLGKCDAHIAHLDRKWGPPGHNKWDTAYTLGVVKPAVIVTNIAISRVSEPTMKNMLKKHSDLATALEYRVNPIFLSEYAPNKMKVNYDCTTREIYLSNEAAKGRRRFLTKPQFASDGTQIWESDDWVRTE